MKFLFLFSGLIIVLAFKTSAQTTAVSDSIAYGSVVNNFPGGQDAYNKYINKNACYPGIALQTNTQGCCYLRFIIETDGSITNIINYRNVGFGMDEEAKRLVQHSGHWIPNKVSGASIRTICSVAVNYKLVDDGNGKIKGIVDGSASNQSYLDINSH